MADETPQPSLLTDQPISQPAPSEASLLSAETKSDNAIDDAPKVDKKTSAESNDTIAKQNIPDKYELKLKENSVLNQGHVDNLATFAKERGLTNEQAQKILDRDESTIDEFRQKELDQRRALSARWVSSVKADEEIGGDNFKKSIELSHRLVNKFGSQSLKEALNESGFGNHPELIRFVSRIAKSMSDDQLVMPQSQPLKPRDLTLAEALYGRKDQK